MLKLVAMALSNRKPAHNMMQPWTRIETLELLCLSRAVIVTPALEVVN